MVYEIKWTKTATNRLTQILGFLEKEWGERSAHKFASRLQSFLQTIAKHPEIGRVEIENVNLRSFVLTRQNTIFYAVRGHTIVIITLFDNRQHPKKRK